MSTSPNMGIIEEECYKFHLDNNALMEVQSALLEELKKGLSKSTYDSAELKCYITYVHDLPTGQERGKFLSLAFGSTNFRVFCITLNEDSNDMAVVTYDLPQQLMRGEGEALFDYIAECLAEFIKQQNLESEDEELVLGFTFSFPLKQSSLTRGSLVKWTKRLATSGVVNMDVAQLLTEAIDRRSDVKIKVTALLNDTTETLMSCAYKNPDCRIGLIVGTGLNACYMEKLSSVETFEEPEPPNKTHVIINTELGGFGDHGSLNSFLTKYDRMVDDFSINPAHQTFEKLISGMYMGELIRLVIVGLVNKNALLSGKSSDLLNIEGSFKTNFVTAIEEDSPGYYRKCVHCLNDLGINHATNEDCRAIRMICEAVSRRAAFLCAAALSALLVKIDEKSVTIGVDGSVYRYHPVFKTILETKVRELTTPSIQFELMLSDDGSGRGAALLAAVCR